LEKRKAIVRVNGLQGKTPSVAAKEEGGNGNGYL